MVLSEAFQEFGNRMVLLMSLSIAWKIQKDMVFNEKGFQDISLKLTSRAHQNENYDDKHYDEQFWLFDEVNTENFEVGD